MTAGSSRNPLSARPRTSCFHCDQHYGNTRQGPAPVVPGARHVRRACLCAGRSAKERLAEKGLDDWLALSPKRAREDSAFGELYTLRCGFMLGRQLNALPAIGDRHMVEFFPGFLNGPDSVEKYGLVRTSIADREKGAAVRPHAVREALIVEAALEGSFDKALAALTTDPPVGNADIAGPLLEELIAATVGWLPQF